MKIGILNCHCLEDKFASCYGQYPEMFQKMLTHTDHPFTYSIYNAFLGELPSHREECDAYLITGSSHGVNDGYPWIAALESFVRTLHQAQKKVIGICFGHQLIAKALGGKVSKSPHGWGVGISKNRILKQKPWMDPVRDSINLLLSHQDQVVELPSDTHVLASNDVCPFYMIQIGNNLTMQGHPEFSNDYAEALIKSRKAILGTECYEQALQSLQWDKDDLIVAQWITNFLTMKPIS